MIMVIIMIGGLLLSATAIAGILMIYQIRQANDAASSAQAFFAADAALEWQLAVTYAGYNGNENPLNSIFTSGSLTATSTVTPIEGIGLDFVSQGFSGNTVRALETIFTQ